MIPGSGESNHVFIERCVMRYGLEHRVPQIAEVVLDVYHAAIKISTRTTYNTGQRAYRRFIDTLYMGVRFPFQRRELSITELNLAFFMAHLLLKPSISVGSTIINYETHVKY